jgi:hypothetical protein
MGWQAFPSTRSRLGDLHFNAVTWRWSHAKSMLHVHMLSSLDYFLLQCRTFCVLALFYCVLLLPKLLLSAALRGLRHANPFKRSAPISAAYKNKLAFYSKHRKRKFAHLLRTGDVVMFPPHPFDVVNVAVELCDIPRLCFRHYMPAAPCMSIFVVKLIGRALYGLFVESMRILLTVVYAGLLSVGCQIDFLWQNTHNIRQVLQRRRHWSLQQLRMNMIVQIRFSQLINIRTIIIVGCSIYAQAIPVGIMVQLLMCIFEACVALWVLYSYNHSMYERVFTAGCGANADLWEAALLHNPHRIFYHDDNNHSPRVVVYSMAACSSVVPAAHHWLCRGKLAVMPEPCTLVMQ